jgi:hypothetical protein
MGIIKINYKSSFFFHFSCFIFFIFLILCSINVFAYTIGISPDILKFNTSEQKLVLYNPNNFDIDFILKGCDYDFIEVIRNGKINSKTNRILLVRYNSKLNTNISLCNLEIFFDNNLYATGITISLLFPLDNFIDETSSFLSDFLGYRNSNSNNETLLEDNSDINFIFIIIVSTIFLLIILIIIKFL